MNAVVEARGLSRFYGLVLGLNNVNFAVRAGLTGVVGPNGAGKTTLFRLLTGQIRPSSGTITVFGANPWNTPAVLGRIGYCPEGEAVPVVLRPPAWLTGLAMVSGASAAEARSLARTCLERVRLPADHWRKPLGELSKGMRQRVKLAQCLLHDPDLFIFDEPLNGLDPMGREDFLNVLRELAAGGKAVLISSHILQDLDALCREFIILRHGRIPRSLNEATSPGARKQWPAATTFRCADPLKLARYFFDQGLVRGWDAVPGDAALLHVRWDEPERFYADFTRHLRDSGVAITEVRATESLLDKALESPPRS
jgi:ABC-2 type transport system ATP-binding protein